MIDVESLVASATEVDDLPSLDDVQKSYVLAVIQRVEGNLSRAARVLGVDRRTVYRQLGRWKVRVERHVTPATVRVSPRSVEVISPRSVEVILRDERDDADLDAEDAS